MQEPTHITYFKCIEGIEQHFLLVEIEAFFSDEGVPWLIRLHLSIPIYLDLEENVVHVLKSCLLFQ